MKQNKEFIYKQHILACDNITLCYDIGIYLANHSDVITLI